MNPTFNRPKRPPEPIEAEGGGYRSFRLLPGIGLRPNPRLRFADLQDLIGFPPHARSERRCYTIEPERSPCGADRLPPLADRG